MKKIVSLLLLFVVAAGGFGIWYYVIRDDAPAKLTVTTRTTVAGSTGPDGAYSVQGGADTVAGFRIDEKFGPLAHTAVVRTPAVTGTMTLQGKAITDAKITVDMTKLESKDAQPPKLSRSVENRIGFLQFGGLEISKFPNATFEASSITLAAAPAKGANVKVDATGKLTIHGVTKNVTIPLTAVWNGQVIDVSGTLPVALADYGMTPPSLPFVTVADIGSLEFKVVLAKS